MDCNCNNNNTNVIPHVYGNVLSLAIPLTLRTIEVVDGEVEATDTDFIPSSDHPVKVIFSRGTETISLEATMRDGNIACVEDYGTIPIGTYDITVKCKDDQGRPYRFHQKETLAVFNATSEAGITSPIEYEAKTWYLNAAIYLALGGSGVTDAMTKTTYVNLDDGLDRIKFSKIPNLVLDFIEVDDEQHEYSNGMFYGTSDGHVRYINGNGRIVDYGVITHMAFINGADNAWYRWNGSEWTAVGGSAPTPTPDYSVYYSNGVLVFTSPDPTYANGNLIFHGSTKPTYSNGNLIL